VALLEVEGGVVGFTLRGNKEAVEGVVLTVRMWKRIAFVGNLCLERFGGDPWWR
jgi:hypothetical protein